MPTGPAARRLDPVAHKVPGRLMPGPGSPDVLIGGLPAWRARVDRHECRHGPGVVVDGSPTVLINGQPACRVGDMVVEGRERNRIIGGCTSVLIGDMARQILADHPTGFREKSRLEEILKDYQTPDDKPSATALLFGVKITREEFRLLKQLAFGRIPESILRYAYFINPGFTIGYAVVSMIRLQSEAFAAADAAYPMPEGWEGTAAEWTNLGHNDAFRHAYWNARMTQTYGLEWTTKFATAHEGIAGNLQFYEAQDLYNNEQGRMIGAANPRASPEAIARLVQEKIYNGELIVVGDGAELRWSNHVPVGRHHIPKDK